MVMGTVGHSDIAVTVNIYSHVISASQQEATGQRDAMRSDQARGKAGDDQDHGVPNSNKG
jgi:hypothetical protein